MISVIIPVYNRPSEVDDMLRSLCSQTFHDFEVVIAEDGSKIPCKEVVDSYCDRLKIVYCVQQNGGPGPARNFGARNAAGDFFIFFDSDCIVPPTYMEVVRKAVYEDRVRVFGGPDMADENFTPMQKAVSYSMTSFFTTGGIRGGKRKLDRFIPRSFNLGIAREVFEMVRGFSPMRFGEDIDISMRMIEGGESPVLLADAAVYHKRRTNMGSFFRQVYFSGVARINLYKRHPRSLKIVHLLPTAFTLMSLLCLLLSWVHPAVMSPIALAVVVWFVDSSIRNRSIYVGWLSIWTSFIQLYGYGTGLMVGVWKRLILKRSEADTYRTNFF